MPLQPAAGRPSPPLLPGTDYLQIDPTMPRHSSFFRSVSCLLVSGAMLAACQPYGPSRQAILKAGTVPAGPVNPAADIKIVTVRGDMANQLKKPTPWQAFSDVLAGILPVGTTVGIGDVLEMTIWEAPPATLFGSATLDTRASGGISTSRPTSVPELMVGTEGTITIPFAGVIPANGRSLREIESEIIRRLRGKANAPQVQVRVIRNATATVTVVGEVSNSSRVSITPRGERLLDVLAQVGGVKPPVNLTTIQVTRNGQIHRMVMSDIIERSENNIVLARDDVVTALFQPYSFTVLGAANRNDEIRFEAMGITLSQALGRIGGLQDGRANPRGIFLFRWEEPAIVGGPRVPVIYSFDLKDPAVYFLAQQFRMTDKDLVYITNAPVAELQRFVSIVSQTILPIATVTTVIRQN
jgi:polysaccharide biosynthesis/export protein